MPTALAHMLCAILINTSPVECAESHAVAETVILILPGFTRTQTVLAFLCENTTAVDNRRRPVDSRDSSQG